MTNAISAEEKTQLSSWLSSNESNKLHYEEIKTLWNLSVVSIESKLIETDVSAQLNKLHNSLGLDLEVESTPVVRLNNAKKTKKKNFPWLKMAAGFAIIMGIVLVLRTFAGTKTNDFVQSTGVNEVESIEMLDGSVISLNETSQLTFYPHIKSERRVKLSGEAFFDVARDESKPFLVETNNAIISVLGTSFTIKTTENNETFVFVKSGKVKVSSKDNKQSEILTKGQRIKVGSTLGEILNPGDIASEDFDGVVNNDNVNFKKVITSLELKYGQAFTYNERLNACEINGGLVDKDLDEILAILKTAFSIEAIESQNGEINLVGGRCK